MKGLNDLQTNRWLICTPITFHVWRIRWWGGCFQRWGWGWRKSFVPGVVVSCRLLQTQLLPLVPLTIVPAVCSQTQLCQSSNNWLAGHSSVLCSSNSRDLVANCVERNNELTDLGTWKGDGGISSVRKSTFLEKILFCGNNGRTSQFVRLQICYHTDKLAQLTPQSSPTSSSPSSLSTFCHHLFHHPWYQYQYSSFSSSSMSSSSSSCWFSGIIPTLSRRLGRDQHNISLIPSYQRAPYQASGWCDIFRISNHMMT